MCVHACLWFKHTQTRVRRHTNPPTHTHACMHSIATLIDVAGGFAISTMGAQRHVSIDLNSTYLGSSEPGEVVRIIGRCPRVGGRIGFSDVELWRKRRPGESPEDSVRPNGEDEVLVASGRHTKYIFRDRPPRAKL